MRAVNTVLDYKNLEVKKRLFLSAFIKNKCNITQTCRVTGINKQTYYNWKKSDELFNKYLSEVGEIVTDHVEGRLHELIDNLNPSAVIFYLKTKGKHRGYQQSANIDHTNSDGSLNRRILQVNPISNDIEDAKIIDE